MNDNVHQLERVRYWQGQLLASGDLRTQMRVVAELRRQHNRALHSAFGVAMGLAASQNSDGSLTLSCGLAYDCSGRELMVPVDLTVPLPATTIAAPNLLTIAYDTALGSSTLAWQPQGAPVASDNVAIARILPNASGPQLDPGFRPVVARPLARPKIANGQTVPGNTAWESWDENGVSIGVQSVVDTSPAGFTATPNYFAEVVTDDPPAGFVPGWFTSISEPEPGSFTVRLFMRRITREAFDILDPKTQAAKTPSTAGKISLVSGNVFVQSDWVSRLLPIVASASLVTGLSSAGATATLDIAIDGFTAAGQLAFGNPPRLATVTKTPAAATGVFVTVDTPAAFQVSNVVVKIGVNFATARPTTIASIDDSGSLELANPITGLATGDQLGVAQQASLVSAVTATTVTVSNPELFNLNDIVACTDAPVENFTPAKITAIAGASNEILTLTPMIAGVDGMHIAPAHAAGNVQSVDAEAGDVKIAVDQPKLFRAGDVVAKILPGGGYSEPVRVQSVQSGSKSLILSKAIAGLGMGEQVGAADFRVRSTVQAVSGDGLTVTVANASLFPVNSSIALLNDQYAAVAIATVSASLGNKLTLGSALNSLETGSVIALCSLPVTVTVQDIDPNGVVEVSSPGLINAGDFVAASPTHPGIAVVAAVNGSSVQLATPIAGLASGDTLAVVTVSGTLNATPGPGAKVTLDAGNRVRVGDFLATISGWREPGPVRSVAYVSNATGTDLTLYSPLDGLLIGDNVGLASLTNTESYWLQLRLKDPPALTPGDDVLLVGLDRLRGVTDSMYAGVEFVNTASGIVVLGLDSNPSTFTIRPEDLSASVLFLRGSPLALVQNQNLYVSWLACQNPDPMPRPCPAATTSDCPCGKAAQS